MARLHVVARDRSAVVDGDLTLREVITLLNSRGQVFSLRRTFQLYGITFLDERNFISRYKNVFELSDKKSIMDIKVKELETYKQQLFKIPFKVRW